MLPRAAGEYSIQTPVLYEIWIEGYSITGNASGASFMGQAYGKTFEDACIAYNEKYPSTTYDPIRNADWGCLLFYNEADARKYFG